MTTRPSLAPSPLFAVLVPALAIAAGCGGSDDRVQLTITPSEEMRAVVADRAVSLDVIVSGADVGKQSYTGRADGVGKLFADGSERLYYLPSADAQGSLRMDVVVRDVLHVPLAVGHTEFPLLRGQAAIAKVIVTLPTPCDNEVKDEDEGDVDCGGKCERGCGLKKGCNDDRDCAEGGCVRGQCAPAACGNGAMDGDETALDCGGMCPGCLNGEACHGEGDCRSGFCSAAGTCDACAMSDQCAVGTECVEGLCRAPGMTTRPCTVVNGSGTQDFSGNEWGPCKASTCDGGHHIANGACESDSRTCTVNGGSGVQTWNGAGFGPCMATGCNVGQHLEGGVCTSDVKACAVPNGVGNQAWNGTSYGLCLPTMCNPGYHVETTSCVDNTRACAISNGMGQQTWTGSGYGTCMPTSCNGGYHIEGAGCASNTRACVVANGTGTQLWTGSGYGTCMVAMCNGGYHIEGGACQADTQPCPITNGTGTKTWTGSGYGACMVASCNSGYHIESGACMSDSQSCTGEIAHAMAAHKTWTGASYGACMLDSCLSGFHPSGNSCVADLPTITSISIPTGTFWACGCQTLTINGTGFAPGSTVYAFNPAGTANVATGATYVSPTQLQFQYCATTPDFAVPGSHKLYVSVPAGGGLSNNTPDAFFAVATSAPVLLSVTPSSVSKAALSAANGGGAPIYCPSLGLRRFAGACPGAYYGASDTPTGSTLVTPAGLPRSVSSSTPESGATSGAGCIDVTNTSLGTYYFAVRNVDGGENTARVVVTLAD